MGIQIHCFSWEFPVVFGVTLFVQEFQVVELFADPRINCTLLKTVVPVFWLCTFVALWIVSWATHGLPLRASVYRGCPCWDAPMCLDAQGGIKTKRQPFVVVGVWSCQCLVVVQTRSTWLHPSALVRVSCLTTILDSRTLERENTYIHCQKNTSPTPSRVQGVSHEYSSYQTDALDLGLLMVVERILLLLQVW